MATFSVYSLLQNSVFGRPGPRKLDAIAVMAENQLVHMYLWLEPKVPNLGVADLTTEGSKVKRNNEANFLRLNY